MAMKKIKQGDQVVILAGKDKGRTGRVLSIRKKDGKAFVEGINLVKKHQKPNPNLNVQGGIIEKEAAIHISNLAALNPATNKADRIGFKFLENGEKVRYFKSNQEILDD